MEFYKSIWTFPARCRVVAYSYYFICLHDDGGKNCTKIPENPCSGKLFSLFLMRNAFLSSTQHRLHPDKICKTDDVGCSWKRRIELPDRRNSIAVEPSRTSLIFSLIRSRLRSDNLLSFYQSIAELRHEHYIYRFNVICRKRRASMFSKSLTFSQKIHAYFTFYKETAQKRSVAWSWKLKCCCWGDTCVVWRVFWRVKS